MVHKHSLIWSFASVMVRLRGLSRSRHVLVVLRVYVSCTLSFEVFLVVACEIVLP